MDIHHGEGISSVPNPALCSQSEDNDAGIDPMEQMLMEGFGMYDAGALGEEEGCEDEDDVDAEAYYKLVCDGSQELYPGCKAFSKLQFLIRLLSMKNRWGVSNGYFHELLPLLKDALPEGEVLPKNFHEAKRFVKAIGIGYHCIDACRNDCILFRKEYANANCCPVCKSSRWKSVKGGVDGRRVHKVPVKVVRHFPLKKRLQRLFMSSKTADNMRWHSEGRTKDGLLRHPADSPAWKNFDGTHGWFSSEARNVRLGLATDGFNPFGNMNVSYSVWPIILIPYNLPPWVCMKQSNLILSVLIPGKKAPGKDIDVYMQLVIDDLLELWKHGVMTYDVSCNEKFHLHAALLWTISDWLGRGVISGESIAACSHCLIDTCSLRLKHGHKTCYMGHRRFLDADHEFRFQARLFDGTQEFREAPIQLSGQEISEMTKDMVTVFGKLQKDKNKKRKRNAEVEEVNQNDLSKVFKKRCCLFQLPYWKTLLVRHNIDVMHTEKNVFGNIINTFLDADKRSKDNLNARLDLQEMDIRPDLHPQTEGTKSYIPPAIYSLSPEEKRMFCQVLKDARFPAGYASNLHNKVLIEEKRLVGLKTHDCHIIMCDLLPLAANTILPNRVSMPLVRLSNYFKKLYSKVICVSEIERMEAEIPEILCQLEKIFPPSFFDIMVHLTVHLATEVRLAGPVHYRNMYPIERCLSKYKSMVTTHSHPEGAIAEGYQFNESMTFCSRYLQSTSKHPSTSASHLPYLKIVGFPLSGPSAYELSYTTWIQAHRYVLMNYPHICKVLANILLPQQAIYHIFNMQGKIRNVRGPTKMKRMWKEYDPNSKIQLKFNRYGQPCGLKTCKLTSFIGYLVRGKEISLGHKNWSKVDKSHKEKLWTTIKGFFDIDESYKPWVLKSASKKWKDFKVVLKRKYFDADLSRRQNIKNGCGNRIPAPQWEWLVDHWMSNAGQLKFEKNKATRALQLNGRHTTGSRSNAVVLDQMELKEGRQIGRAELFVVTHTKKNGQPVDEYSFEKIDEIQRRFQEDPSLLAEDTYENDLFSTLFPKERSGRRTGLGLLAGGVGSARISEALFEMQEVKEENKKLWDVVKTLMSNQDKLQHQYTELKSQVLDSQKCPSTETSPRVGTAAGQHLHDMNNDNQESVPHSNKRHGVEHEDAMLPSLRKIKIETAQDTFVENSKRKTPPQSVPESSKKLRKFQPPLHKDDVEDLKCGLEVGLTSPNSKKLVALGTIQKTDRKAKAHDGQPLADYVDVLVSIVYKQTTILPRAYGKIQNLGSATARCILWPRQSIISVDGTPLNSKCCSTISQVNPNTTETTRLKRATSKADGTRLNKGMAANKQFRRKVCIEKTEQVTSSKSVEGHKSDIYITTSRC